jgi:hypothetical protein
VHWHPTETADALLGLEYVIMLLLMLCACYLHHAVSGSLHHSSYVILGLHSNAGRSPILPYPLHYDTARRIGFEQMQHQEYWSWPVPMKDTSHPLSLVISHCIVAKGRWIVLFTALLLSTRICCFEIICALPARRIVDYAVALAHAIESLSKQVVWRLHYSRCIESMAPRTTVLHCNKE